MEADQRRAVRAIAFAARKLERAAGELTVAQYRVLALVADGDERSTLLAHRLAVAKPTVTAVVDGLVERKLLTREAVEGDRRSLRLALTPAGRRALEHTEAAMADALEAVLATTHDRSAVLGALAELDDAMTRYFTERLRS
ncbi:MAG: MarR family winged helix-turn-helix transcriptional regulator [Actinomycetota bacterium]